MLNKSIYLIQKMVLRTVWELLDLEEVKALDDERRRFE